MDIVTALSAGRTMHLWVQIRTPNLLLTLNSLKPLVSLKREEVGGYGGLNSCCQPFLVIMTYEIGSNKLNRPKDDLFFCSFAVVIQQLPEDLRNSVCVFYLVLRAMDTVEDDMAIPVEEKLPVLKSFHRHICDK